MSPQPRPPRTPGTRKDGAPRENAVEADARFKRFAELYVQYHGNAHRAALEAGYPADFAKSHGYRLAARLRLKMGPVMRRYGLDEVFVARKIRRLARAKTPKWNSSRVVRPAQPAVTQDGKEVQSAVSELRGDWDYFEDAGTQMRAIELTAELLDLKPAHTVKGEGPGGAIQVVLKHSIARPERAG